MNRAESIILELYDKQVDAMPKTDRVSMLAVRRLIDQKNDEIRRLTRDLAACHAKERARALGQGINDTPNS